MARLEGTIRSAGEGVGGLRVVAFEETRVGFELDDKPCRSSHPSISNFGEATTDEGGGFSIQFEPQPVRLRVKTGFHNFYVTIVLSTRLDDTIPSRSLDLDAKNDAADNPYWNRRQTWSIVISHDAPLRLVSVCTSLG